MQTALIIVSNALREIGIVPPSTLMSTTDKTQLQLKSLLYAELRYLRNSAKWPQAKRSYSFTLESGRSQYPLPSDFHAMVNETQWNQTTQRKILGPTTDELFDNYLYSSGAGNIDVSYRIRGADNNVYTAGGQFEIYPTPTANGEILSFDYFTANLFIPPFWTPGETGITVGKWRYVNDLYLYCSAITTGTTGATAPTAAGVDGGVTWQVLSQTEATKTGNYEVIQSDNDLALYDEDLVTVGFKWRWLKAKGRDYAVEAQEYRRMLEVSMTRWTGSYRGSMTGQTFGPRYTVQQGGWTF